jgi:hypothetical protein
MYDPYNKSLSLPTQPETTLKEHATRKTTDKSDHKKSSHKKKKKRDVSSSSEDDSDDSSDDSSSEEDKKKKSKKSRKSTAEGLGKAPKSSRKLDGETNTPVTVVNS